MYVSLTLYPHFAFCVACVFRWCSGNLFRQCSTGDPPKTVFECKCFSHDNTEYDKSESTNGVPLGYQTTYFPSMNWCAWLWGKSTSNFFCAGHFCLNAGTIWREQPLRSSGCQGWALKGPKLEELEEVEEVGVRRAGRVVFGRARGSRTLLVSPSPPLWEVGGQEGGAGKGGKEGQGVGGEG